MSCDLALVDRFHLSINFESMAKQDEASEGSAGKVGLYEYKR